MTQLVILVPWPPRALSPNARVHWRKLAAAKTRYRRCCWAEAWMFREKFPRPHTGRFLIEFQFSPPDKRRYDQDNLVARMKAGQDGIAEAFGVDDNRFDLGAPQMGAVTKGGCVWIRITKVAT